MKNFEGLNLSPLLAESLASMNYTAPTPIQAQAIPYALDGHDIMGTAQTGTGKTAAFAIPLVERLLQNEHGSALVLTPTRELGKQIMDIMHQLLGRKSGINTAFIIGGEAMGKQYAQLRKNPRLIVGTPGRINDHLERNSLKLDDTDFLVLDETDRMLDMGFTDQLERIFRHMPDQRQTLMFSATLPKNILKLSEKYMASPKRVAVGETNVVAKNIKQEVIRIEQADKYKELLMQLHERQGSVIVFVKTKHGADRMAKNLRRDGFTSEALHGDLKQNKRDKVMKNFRVQNFRILIATDIAARGLDVPHIEHVVNFDLPQVAEDFIHRMGRTARAGAQGSAISFVSNQDWRKWRAIEQLINPGAKSEGPDQHDRKSGKKRKPRSGGAGGGFKKKAEGKPARSDFKKKRFDKGGDNESAPDQKKSGGKKEDRAAAFKRKQKVQQDDRPKFNKKRDDKGGDDRPKFNKKRDDKGGDDRPPFGNKPKGGKPGAKKKAYGQPKSFAKPKQRPNKNAKAGGFKRKGKPGGATTERQAHRNAA